MKTDKPILPQLISLLVALSISVSACNLADLYTNVCATPTLSVTKVEDTNAGLCSPSDCSLREALIASNSCKGTQTIQIPSGTYRLTLTGADEDAAGTGDLDLTDSATIQGDGHPIIDGVGADRIFDIKTGQSVTLSGLVLQNGKTPLFGSAIANQGNLTIEDVLLQNNHQTDKSGSGVTIFTYDLGSSLDISNSALVNNWAAVEAAGLYNVAGTMTIENVTVSGNHGYGVANAQGGQTQIKYSTIADDFGLYEIWNPGIGTAVQVSNSIIAGRTTDGNCFQPVDSGGFNIDSAHKGTSATCGLSRPSDLAGTDPVLLPLANNDGSTATLALDPASPAVNSADPNACGGTDQRGVERPQGTQCDRGAFELQNPPTRPTATSAPTRTRPPQPSATPAKGSNGGNTLTFTTNANCRTGPGTGYFMVTPIKQGLTASIKGQNNAGTWVLIQVPASEKSCWVSLLLGSLSGSLSGVPTLPSPPIPATPEKFKDSSKCSASQRTVTLTWTLTPNAVGYNIYRGDKLLKTLNALTTTYQDVTSPHDDFFYAIEAFNENGISARLTTQVQACP